MRKYVCLPLFIVALFVALSKPAYAGVNEWTAIGPEGGQITALAIDPSDTSILYSGVLGGGLFKSTNGGSSWTALNTGVENPYVRSLSIDPLNSSVLYACLSGYPGMLRSTDGGANWTPINTGMTVYVIEAVAIDPKAPFALYAATYGGGILKSIDGGTNWSAVNTGLSDLYVLQIAVDPVNSLNIYAGTRDGHIFKSTDGGATWSSAYSDSTGIANMYVHSLAINPLNPAIIYAATNGGGVLKSSDSGTSWSFINNGLTEPHIQTLAINMLNPALLFAGSNGGGIYKSIDNGDSWSVVNDGLAEQYVTALSSSSTSSSTIYAGTYSLGLFKSTDGGLHWTAINKGLTGQDVFSFSVNPSDPAVLYAGSNGRIHKSIDKGSHWTSVAPGLTGVSCPTTFLSLDPSVPSTLYAKAGCGAYKSSNAGADWSRFDLGVSYLDFESLAIDPTNSSIMYANTTNGINKTVDAGVSWQLTTLTGIGSNDHIWDNIAIDPSDPNTVYVGVTCGVYKSTDGGTNWKFQDIGLNCRMFNALRVSLSAPGTLYAVTDAGITATNDGGLIWTPVSTNVGCAGKGLLTIDGLIVHPNNPDVLYGKTFGCGVFKSTDGGAHWSEMNTGLSNRFVRALSINPINTNTIYAATAGNSVWQMELPEPVATVIDATYPYTDHKILFGNILQGQTAEQAVTVKNNGNMDLVIGTITSTATLTAPFSIIADNCSGQTIMPNMTCDLTVRFAPFEIKSYSASFDIPSDDPHTPIITVNVSGTGLSSTVNNPPSTPILVFPANGQSGMSSSVTFRWTRSADPDGDSVTYNLYTCLESSFSSCNPVTTAQSKAIYLTGIGTGSVILGVFMVGGTKRKDRVIVYLLALAIGSLLACSRSGKNTTSLDLTEKKDEVRYTISGLNAGSKYYWKVVSNDGKGGSRSSDVRSFTTQ